MASHTTRSAPGGQFTAASHIPVSITKAMRWPRPGRRRRPRGGPCPAGPGRPRPRRQAARVGSRHARGGRQPVGQEPGAVRFRHTPAERLGVVVEADRLDGEGARSTPGRRAATGTEADVEVVLVGGGVAEPVEVVGPGRGRAPRRGGRPGRATAAAGSRAGRGSGRRGSGSRRCGGCRWGRPRPAAAGAGSPRRGRTARSGRPSAAGSRCGCGGGWGSGWPSRGRPVHAGACPRSTPAPPAPPAPPGAGGAWQSGPVKRPVLVRPRSVTCRRWAARTTGSLVVRVHEPATDGRANRAVVDAVAVALGVGPALRSASPPAPRPVARCVEVDGDEARWRRPGTTCSPGTDRARRRCPHRRANAAASRRTARPTRR